MIQLSIIIPAYNVADYITGTLQSVLRQNSERLEIIVVDDGATDNTAQVVQQVIDHSGAKNIRLYRKENGGVSSARNHGFEQAKGMYVLFLDGDDFLGEGFVPSILSLLDAQQPDVLHWPYDLVDEQGGVVAPFPYQYEDRVTTTGAQTLRAILLERSTRIWTCSIAYRRQLLLEHGIMHTVGCRVGEDAEFIYKALMHAKTVLFTKQLKTLYLQRGSSVMSTYSIRKFDAVSAMQRVQEELSKHDGAGFAALQEHFKNHEVLHYYAGTYRLCLQHLVNAQGMAPKQAVRRLNKDMDATYPGLRVEMARAMAGRNTGIRPDRLTLFRLSPLMYFRLSQWSDKRRGIKQG